MNKQLEYLNATRGPSDTPDFTLDEVIDLLDELRRIRVGYRSNTGICGNLPRGERVIYLLRVISQDWPMHSGSDVFPVPAAWDAPDVGMSRHSRAYYSSARSGRWSKETTYGRNRWALLEYCISRCEHIIADKEM